MWYTSEQAMVRAHPAHVQSVVNRPEKLAHRLSPNAELIERVRYDRRIQILLGKLAQLEIPLRLSGRYATRYCSMTASSTSTPKPCPAGTERNPFFIRKGSFTSMRLKGPCDVLNSTNSARR